MTNNFDNLRIATSNCIEGRGDSPNGALFEFRNAAKYTIVHELLRENDRLREQAAIPVAPHSLGTLSAAERSLLLAYRNANEHSKMTIQIAAEVSSQVDEEFAARDRCEVVDIGSACVIKE